MGWMPISGTVYLVGAGPGSADLITLRGLRILQRADVVLHDALILQELLEEVSAHAEVLSVGKRGYCTGSTRQETINDAMIRLAREGKSICRLKCGDPCVFGRGGEEAEILAEAGIPFEFVPGVTSAIGACAAAGIPLTHRDVGQAVAFVTGHHDPDSPECTLDWQALARLPGLVFYMASRYIARIAAKLCDNGLSLQTPVAIIESGTLQNEQVRTGTLGDMALSLAPGDVTAPAIFVVGECVRYRHKPFGSQTEKNATTP